MAEGVEWDYVIVGSGAGGGTLAARLVEEGMRVFLIEAGIDPSASQEARLPDDYDVPAFHAFATENAALRWDFHVRHYGDEAQQSRDPKYEPGKGVLYPRAATLGGCTAHNAMIFVLPHDSDWNHIATATGDVSWHASHMRRYSKRLEDCHHAWPWRLLSWVGINPTKHGFGGWLRTEKAVPLKALGDSEVLGLVRATTKSFIASLRNPVQSIVTWLRGAGDPNARPWTRRSYEGLCYTPMTTKGHRRIGTRERLLDVQDRHRGSLHIEYDALATRVLLDDGNVARGIAYRKGARLYRAHAQPSGDEGESREVLARREVILCGGAFNTPQLLMLSGIGDAAHLREHGIAVKVDLPGVGRNLQDRYEVGITHRVRRPWEVLAGARFARNDPLWKLWNGWRKGMYDSNGAAIAMVRRSSPDLPEPDIFCMALLSRFEGYRPGFSDLIRDSHDDLTWAVLKAHTENRAGTVRLRSADPRDMPLIEFHYFEEGSDRAARDLAAVVEAIGFVRKMTAPLIESGLVVEELQPGRDVKSDAQIATFVRDTAWGHHASCSCPIGKPEEGGVVDSAFRVHGTQGLRIVDASVFPRIPGFFIASAVYMIGEKAADTLLQVVRARQ
jgi:choline dehydrogenase